MASKGIRELPLAAAATKVCGKELTSTALDLRRTDDLRRLLALRRRIVMGALPSRFCDGETREARRQLTHELLHCREIQK
jgi:hypothetical protein